MRWFMCVVVAVFAAAPAAAQSPATSYQLNWTVSPVTPPPGPFTFLATSVSCNQAPTAGGSTVNPNKIEWNDPAIAGRVCRYTAQPGDALLALPLGAYQAKLVAINAAGASAESNAAPFQRDAALPAPTGLQLVR